MALVANEASECLSDDELRAYYNMEKCVIERVSGHLAQCESCFNRYAFLAEEIFEKEKKIIEEFGIIFLVIQDEK